LNENGVLKDASDLLPNQGGLGIINDIAMIQFSESQPSKVILAREWNSIGILAFNDGKFEFETNKAFDEASGWWNCLTIADVDNDGDMDILAGNRGENSFYSASREKPAKLVAFDFDDNGSLDAFPAYVSSIDNILYAKHTLDEVFMQYPLIRRKFNRYEPFANATFDELFDPKDLEKADSWKVTTFETSWFENLDNANFERKSLPNEAQFSETKGILATDINQDGHLDLLITGNNYGVDVEMGQSDANKGCVLIGDGKGSFTATPPYKSGFSLKGDHRGVYSLTRLDEQLILVLTNNGNLQSFEVNE